MLKITFLTGTNLVTGRGTEKFLLNIMKNAPKEVSCTIVQTDYIVKQRVTQEYVNSMLKGARLLTAKKELDSPLIRKLQKIRYSNKFLNYPLGAITHPLTIHYWHKENLKILREAINSDIIYLVDNNYIEFLKVKPSTLVIGSTHHKKFAERFKFFSARYRRIDGIHFQTMDSMKNAVFRKPLDFYVQSGVDTALYKPAVSKNRTKKVRLLFVSGLDTSKGLLTAIEACKTLPDNFELNIVGKGALENYVKNLNIKNLFYHGVLSEKSLAKMYRDCDILVFPSPGETFGLVVIEAIASGEFVITTKGMKGNFNELRDLGSLEYVDNDPISFANAIKKAAKIIKSIDYPQARKESVAFVRKTYDWRIVSKIFFKKLLKAYELKNKNDLNSNQF